MVNTFNGNEGYMEHFNACNNLALQVGLAIAWFIVGGLAEYLWRPIERIDKWLEKTFWTKDHLS